MRLHRIRTFAPMTAAALLLAACNTTAPMEINRPDPETVEAVADQEEADELVQGAMFGESEFKPIAFTAAISSIRHGTVVLHFPANGVDGLSGTLCNYRHQGESVHEWSATGRLLGDWDSEVGTMIYNALRQRGFDIAGDPDALFERDDARNRAEFLLGARLMSMVGNACEEHHWIDGRALGKYSAEVQIEVDWIVYDPLRKQPVDKFTTTGYGVQKKPKRTGIFDAFFSAWGSATERLAVDPEFTKLLAVEETGTFRSEPIADAPITIERIPLRDLALREYMADVLDATVSIRTGFGIGSGYLISRDGYILTNQHVTGEAENVTVVFRNGIEVRGRVIRRHAQRDVALIQTPITGGTPFPLRLEEPEITDDVYAIGNPLDEELKSTVTRGVVSAKRRNEKTGLRLIQADVDIQGGNSGGPLVDENGNVIAMSVSGISSTPGRGAISIGINFFIPIESALRFLQIRVAEDVALN